MKSASNLLRASSAGLTDNFLQTEKCPLIPLDGADVFQQGGIDSIGDRVPLGEDPGDLPRLPVDDARQDQVGYRERRGTQGRFLSV
jgi:hypothetical protein